METLELDATIDAVDQLEFPDDKPTTTTNGIAPQLAALSNLIRSGKPEGHPSE